MSGSLLDLVLLLIVVCFFAVIANLWLVKRRIDAHEEWLKKLSSAILRLASKDV